MRLQIGGGSPFLAEATTQIMALPESVKLQARTAAQEALPYIMAMRSVNMADVQKQAVRTEPQGGLSALSAFAKQQATQAGKQALPYITAMKTVEMSDVKKQLLVAPPNASTIGRAKAAVGIGSPSRAMQQAAPHIAAVKETGRSDMSANSPFGNTPRRIGRNAEGPEHGMPQPNRVGPSIDKG